MIVNILVSVATVSVSQIEELTRTIKFGMSHLKMFPSLTFKMFPSLMGLYEMYSETPCSFRSLWRRKCKMVTINRMFMWHVMSCKSFLKSRYYVMVVAKYRTASLYIKLLCKSFKNGPKPTFTNNSRICLLTSDAFVY